MGLGISKEGIYTKYEIPLFGGFDPNWKDNTWIVAQLRMLASEIEEKNIEIYKISLDVKHDGIVTIPSLVVTQITP